MDRCKLGVISQEWLEIEVKLLFTRPVASFSRRLSIGHVTSHVITGCSAGRLLKQGRSTVRNTLTLCEMLRFQRTASMNGAPNSGNIQYNAIEYILFQAARPISSTVDARYTMDCVKTRPLNRQIVKLL